MNNEEKNNTQFDYIVSFRLKFKSLSYVQTPWTKTQLSLLFSWKCPAFVLM